MHHNLLHMSKGLCGFQSKLQKLEMYPVICIHCIIAIMPFVIVNKDFFVCLLRVSEVVIGPYF